MRSLRLLLLLSRLALRPLREQAALSYAVILLVAAVLFGPTAMHPRDLTGLALRHPLFGAALWLVWLVLSATPARVALVNPASFHLRSLPAPRVVLAAVPMLHAVLLQAPWGVLWAVGEGLTAGLACSAVAAGVAALRLAGLRRPLEWIALVALLGAFSPWAPAWLALPAALAAAVVGGAAVFRRAPELAASTGRAWVRGAPVVAVATALLSSLLRAEAVLVLRGALLVLAGAALATLGIRNNQVQSPASLSRVLLAVGAPPLGAALLAVGGAARRADRRADWLLSSLGASRRLRVAAAALAVGAVGFVGGTAHAAVVVAGADSAARAGGRLLLDGALLGALLGATSASLPRWIGDGPLASDRLFGAALALVVTLSIATGLLGEQGLLLAVAAAPGSAALALRSFRRELAVPPGRRIR